MPGTRIRHTGPARRPSAPPAVIAVTSPAFQDSVDIPARTTRAGGNVSPALSWSTLPEGTASIVILVDDPDAPGRTPFSHWVLFNVRPASPGIPEGLGREPLPSEVPGAAQGENGFGALGYDGPAPPPGRGVHRYQFQVFALDETLPLPPGVTGAAVRRRMQGHVLGQGTLVGLFGR